MNDPKTASICQEGVSCTARRDLSITLSSYYTTQRIYLSAQAQKLMSLQNAKSVSNRMDLNFEL